MKAFFVSVLAIFFALFSPQAQASSLADNARAGKGTPAKVKKAPKSMPLSSATRAVVKVTRGARLRIVKGKAELEAELKTGQRTQQTVTVDGRKLFEFQ